MEGHKNHGLDKKITAATLLIALGIIYGDIGTSPLYVLKAVIGNRSIDEVLVYGGLSCVFWTITFQTTLKYVYLTLKADNNGEGGIFSLYALVRRLMSAKCKNMPFKYKENIKIYYIIGIYTQLRFR